MYTEGFEQWVKLNQNLTAPLAELNKTTTQMLQKVYQQQIEMTSDNIARISNQIKRMGHVKKPEEMMTLQKECISENISSAVDNMQKLIQISMQNFEELTKTYGGYTSSQSSEQGKTVSKTGK